MRKGLFRRMLPFSYLKKIGRYDPSVHRSTNSPGFPDHMMEELAMVAEKGEKVKLVGNWPAPTHLKTKYKYNKFIFVEIGSNGNLWVIPSNWVVRV